MKSALLWPLAAIGVSGLAGDVAIDGSAGDPCAPLGSGMSSLSSGECVEMLPPRLYRGTWFVGLEESSFLPAGGPLPAIRVYSATETPPELETWLDIGWPAMQDLLATVPEPGGSGTGRYRVEFIGRQARHAGTYGVGAPHVIRVDRMISIRPAGSVRTRVDLPGVRCPFADLDC